MSRICQSRGILCVLQSTCCAMVYASRHAGTRRAVVLMDEPENVKALPGCYMCYIMARDDLSGYLGLVKSYERNLTLKFMRPGGESCSKSP